SSSKSKAASREELEDAGNFAMDSEDEEKEGHSGCQDSYRRIAGLLGILRLSGSLFQTKSGSCQPPTCESSSVISTTDEGTALEILA
ncbi:hypothetical protein H671_7g17816, partial [Cricetulus griseus]